MKSNQTSVPIIRPQSDTSKKQQPQKKLNPIKVQPLSKSPNQKKIKDQEKTQSSEAEDIVPRHKADEIYSPKIKPKQTTESNSPIKKIDNDIKSKQSRIKPKADIAPHKKITLESRAESKTSVKKEMLFKRKTNSNVEGETKSEKSKFNVRINQKPKENETAKAKLQVKPPQKNENDSKIPIRTQVKKAGINSSSTTNRERVRANENSVKKGVTKQNNNYLFQKKPKKAEIPEKTKRTSEQKIKYNEEEIKKAKEKKDKLEEEDEEEDEEEEEEEEDEEETITEFDFDAYKNLQKETILSKYLKNQNHDNTNINDTNTNENSTINNTNDNKNDKSPPNFNFKIDFDSNNKTHESPTNYKQILNQLSDLDGESQIQCLDDILEEVQSWKSDFLTFNFDAYIELTDKIYKCIKLKKFSSDAALFKASAIIAKIAPLSDKELLKMSLSNLLRMSENSANSELLIECHLVEPLLKICFDDSEIDEMSKSSAKILCNTINNKQVMYEMLQLEAMTMCCKEIASQARRSKFSIEYSYYLNDVLSILIILCEKTSDFSKYSKYSLPINLLTILRTYRNDNSIQNKGSEILKTLLDFDENVELLECKDLSPLFALLESSNQSTVENAIYAISNAISISDFFVDTVAELEPPLGIVGLCNRLKNDLSNPINTEILKCLVKLTSFQQGAEMAVQSFNKVSAFMDIDPYELMNMQNGQTGFVCALQIMKNLAYIVPDRVAAVADGKLKFFCQIGAISIVIELSKIIIKTNKGRQVLEEVRDIPQIASLF